MNKKENPNNAVGEQIVLLRQMIENAEKSIKSAKSLITQLEPTSSFQEKRTRTSENGDDKIVEGTFDGENMIGADGKQYPVPANYASKSKLVEGDTLKLTIVPDGSFVYKQIGPIERKRVIGKLMKDDQGKFYVLAEGRSFKVLLASVTYFKASVGDEVTLLVPAKGESAWGCIENVIKDITNVATENGNRVADITEENTPDLKALEDELKL
jgi:hypothetical protein